MRFLASLFGLMLLALAGAPEAFAQAPAQANACPRPAANWTDTETKVWQQLCEDGTADITPPYGRMEPPQAGQPAPENLLSGMFVRQILTDLPYRDALPSVTIAGAMVTSAVDLNKRSIPMNVTFEQSHFLEGIVLSETQMRGSWTCRQCYSPMGVAARQALVGGGFDFTGTQMQGPLDMGAAIVQGDVKAAGASFSAVVGRGMTVRGSLDLDGAKVPEVVLGGAQIIGDARLSLEGAGTVTVHIASARVGGELVLVARGGWPQNVRIDLTGTSAGALTPPSPWPAATEARDFEVDRASPAVAQWILERLNRATRTDVEAYTHLAGAATAGGNAELARQIQRTLRDRQRADATGSERFWMTVEDLGWISYAIAAALLGLIGWFAMSTYRRRAAE